MSSRRGSQLPSAYMESAIISVRTALPRTAEIWASVWRPMHRLAASASGRRSLVVSASSRSPMGVPVCALRAKNQANAFGVDPGESCSFFLQSGGIVQRMSHDPPVQVGKVSLWTGTVEYPGEVPDVRRIPTQQSCVQAHLDRIRGCGVECNGAVQGNDGFVEPPIHFGGGSKQQ